MPRRSLSPPASSQTRAPAGTPPQPTDRLELVARSLPPPWEDPITLAVEAARPILDADPTLRQRIGLLLVASESGIDDAKPLSSYVHHWLDLPSRCRHAELKHACYGGTLALRLASDWVRQNPNQNALVITTDMARRLFSDPAEPAEGAGATAMLIACSPRVFALGERSAVAAREVYDVMRPTRTAEVIHARRSLAAYLDLFEAACQDLPLADLAPTIAYFLYHTPLIPLVAEAHRQLESELDRDLDFDRYVRPSLAWGQQIGNTYSGSLYVALACLAATTTHSIPAHLLLYSYGSGSCAELYDGLLFPTAYARLARHDIPSRLEARRPVDIPTYEASVLAHEQSLSTPDFSPDLALCGDLYESSYAGRGHLVLDHVEDHYRSYRWS